MDEEFAYKHAEQYRGCIQCKESHHESAFCRKCGKCFFKGKIIEVNDIVGTIVQCQCDEKDLWD